MPRTMRFIAMCFAVVLFASFVPTQPASLGQEATPSSDERLAGCFPEGASPTAEEGVTSQFLAKGLPVPEETNFRTLFLFRYTLAPSPADDPGIPKWCYPETVLVHVEQGREQDALTIVVYEGAIRVRRDAGTAAVSVELVEGVPGGTEVTLGPNDSFFTTAAEYELGNYTDQDTVLIVSVLAQDGAPGGGLPTWPT